MGTFHERIADMTKAHLDAIPAPEVPAPVEPAPAPAPEPVAAAPEPVAQPAAAPVPPPAPSAPTPNQAMVPTARLSAESAARRRAEAEAAQLRRDLEALRSRPATPAPQPAAPAPSESEAWLAELTTNEDPAVRRLADQYKALEDRLNGVTSWQSQQIETAEQAYLRQEVQSVLADHPVLDEETVLHWFAGGASPAQVAAKASEIEARLVERFQQSAPPAPAPAQTRQPAAPPPRLAASSTPVPATQNRRLSFAELNKAIREGRLGV